MRLVQALMLAAICSLPTLADAQDPETPPPAQAQPADRAVRRGEVRAPRGENTNRAPERADDRPVRAPRAEPVEESAERREVVSTPAPAPPAAVASDRATRDETPAVERRGAVRRPPSDVTAASNDRAIPRSEAPPIASHRGGYHGTYYPNYPRYSRYYDPWGYGAFGLGYYYAPWTWFPYGYGGYGSYYPSYQGSSSYDIGRVRLKVKPRDAEVWVDGYYAGTVDDFDGMMQALKLDTGPYRIEIRKPGMETLTFDVRVQPDRTITFRGDMKPIP